MAAGTPYELESRNSFVVHGSIRIFDFQEGTLRRALGTDLASLFFHGSEGLRIAKTTEERI